MLCVNIAVDKMLYNWSRSLRTFVKEDMVSCCCMTNVLVNNVSEMMRLAFWMLGKYMVAIGRTRIQSDWSYVI